MAVNTSKGLARFETFELDLRAGELRKDKGSTVRLSEQPFQILTMLLEHPGEVVTREEIRKKLWPNDTIVEFEHSISAAMNRLRQALGDSADNPRYIETLARRGYRLLVPVEWVGRGAGVSPQPAGIQPRSADLPLKSAAFAEGKAAELQTNSALPSVTSLTGKEVSHYRVLEVLGGGGMGVVYKAEDIKLGRKVALKFLPEELANDRAALERFEREARAASALNHPNICTVYEFGEHEGQPFIAMELLEGQTLRDRLAGRSAGVPPAVAGASRPSPAEQERGQDALATAGETPALRSPLQIDESVDVAIQIADGLEAAHQKGITHRDIKPANIFITTRQQVKILDFGLAKLSGSAGILPASSGEGQQLGAGGTPALPGAPLQNAATATDPHLTRTGAAMGTAAYMSPEQVRGEKLDARTDLFSFGVVLYEMATGRQAFAGGSAAETITAILRDRPVPPSQLNPQLASKLEEIIHKSLEKDRNARYQAASEMRAELRSLKRAIDSGQSVAPELGQAAVVNAAFPGAVREPEKRSRLLAVISALAFIVVVVGGTWLFLSRRSERHGGRLRIVPFSGLSGLEDQAAFSPDGNQLAYTWNGGSGTARHIYVKLIGVGSPLQLTHDSLSDGSPAWSPDGRYIAFMRYPPHGKSEVLSIPALGGPERHLGQVNPLGMPGYARDVTWFPDGKSVVAADKPSPAEPPGIFRLSLEDGERHRVTSPPPGTWGDTDPAFSFDGRTLAFVRWSTVSVGGIYLQNVDGTEARRLTFGEVGTGGPTGLAWTADDRDILFPSWERSSLPSLARFPVSGGETETLTGFGEGSYWPAVSRRGDRLAYTKSEENYNIWSVRVTDTGRMEGSRENSSQGPAVKLTTSSRRTGNGLCSPPTAPETRKSG